MAKRPIVAKIGAGVLGVGDTLFADLLSLQKEGVPTVLVHGGGALISQWQENLGIKTEFVRGLRVTDGPSLEVATAVLAGLVNKVLVSSLQFEGAKAVGLSGVDGGILQADILDPELGFVGKIERVDISSLKALMEEGFLPVLAPLALQIGVGERALGGILNVNADTAAAEISAALNAHRLIYLTDVPGVRDPANDTIARLSEEQAKELVETGIISQGMIPKVEACLGAAGASIDSWIVDGRQPHALLETLSGNGAGTRVGVS